MIYPSPSLSKEPKAAHKNQAAGSRLGLHRIDGLWNSQTMLLSQRVKCVCSVTPLLNPARRLLSTDLPSGLAALMLGPERMQPSPKAEPGAGLGISQFGLHTPWGAPWAVPIHSHGAVSCCPVFSPLNPPRFQLHVIKKSKRDFHGQRKHSSP